MPRRLYCTSLRRSETTAAGQQARDYRLSRYILSQSPAMAQAMCSIMGLCIDAVKGSGVSTLRDGRTRPAGRRSTFGQVLLPLPNVLPPSPSPL